MKAVEKTSGPCVILAGAGTGKTYTIVEKIRHIVQTKVYPVDKVVCITFSNEAANNLTVRISRVLKEIGEQKEPIIRTFHGFSADLLRKYGTQIGIPEKFKILDPEQAMVLLHRSLKTSAFYCQKYIPTLGSCKDLGIKLEDFQEYLKNEMNALKDIDLMKRIEVLNFELQTIHLKKNFSDKKKIFFELKKLRKLLEIKKFVTAWNAYEKIKQKGNYQDYSDLNKNALALLDKNPEIAKDFDYVIVDEFQDTNKLQLDFLFRLAWNRNITVVGDINQSIYRFRGAYKDNLNLFKNHFSVRQNEIYNLDKSFRSSNRILRVAHKLILNNYDNKEDCFFVDNVHNREGQEIEVFELKNAKEEARKVVELVKREMALGVPEDDICVMFRAHQNGRIIKRALENEGIRTISVAKPSLVRQKSVKMVLDYLNILDKIKNKTSGGETSWWDIAYQSNFRQNDLIKFGKKIKELLGNSRNRGEEESEEKKQARECVSVYFLNNLDKLDFSEDGKIAARILLEKIKILLPHLNKSLSEIVKEVADLAGLRNEARTKEETEAIMNLNRLIEIAKMHEEFYDSDLNNFLYYIRILEELDIDLDACQIEEKGVRLMTSHATKGLEYKSVIITNMAQGRFPIERYSGNSLIPTNLLPEIKVELQGLNEQEREDFVSNYEKKQQVLEERRLAYVSFTRAKERLILSYARNYNDKEFSPSSFLNEVDFKKNQDIKFAIDDEEKFVPQEIEIVSASSLSGALDSGDIDSKMNNLVSESEVKKEMTRLSPSSLKLFDECQKHFEYKYVYNMPDRRAPSWEAMKLGSFVHLVLEQGVSSGFRKAEQFLELAKQLSLQEDWQDIPLEECETLIKVFFERNKNKYDEKTKTEQSLPLSLEGFSFIGFADRIDLSESGAEIVDYKTGKTSISPKERNWQLGYYALAAKEKYGKVWKVTLDMLKQDKPLEFVIDEKGNANCITSDRIEGFNIFHVQDEIVDVARRIKQAYEKGFKPCPVEKNCEFCNEYVYNI